MNIELIGPNEGIALRTCSRCNSTLLMVSLKQTVMVSISRPVIGVGYRKKNSKMATQLCLLDENERRSFCSRHEDNIILNQNNSAVFSDLTRNYLPKESWIITHQANIVDSPKNEFR